MNQDQGPSASQQQPSSPTKTTKKYHNCIPNYHLREVKFVKHNNNKHSSALDRNAKSDSNGSTKEKQAHQEQKKLTSPKMKNENGTFPPVDPALVLHERSRSEDSAESSSGEQQQPPQQYPIFTINQQQQNNMMSSFTGVHRQVSNSTHLQYMIDYYNATPIVAQCINFNLYQPLGLDVQARLCFIPFPSQNIYDEMFSFTAEDYNKFYTETVAVINPNTGNTEYVTRQVDTCKVYVGQLPLVHQPYLDHTGSVPQLRFLASLSGIKPLKAEVKRGNNKKASIAVLTVPTKYADMIIAFIHKRCLITQTGIYLAVTHDQIKILHSFCFDMLKQKDDARFQHRPYAPMTAMKELDRETYCHDKKRPEEYSPLCPCCTSKRDSDCPLDIRDIRNENTPLSFIFNKYLPRLSFTMKSVAEQMPTHAYIPKQIIPQDIQWLYSDVNPDTIRITNEKCWKFWGPTGCQGALSHNRYEQVCDLHRPQQVAYHASMQYQQHYAAAAAQYTY